MSSGPELLLAYDFPPMGGGIARMMAEVAKGYPAGGLLVSTGSYPGDRAADASLPNPVDRLGVPAGRLKTLRGLFRWSRRVTALVSRHKAPFIWCGNIRPAAYPARWAHRRTGVPYGIVVYGGDLLSLRGNYRASGMKRKVARSLLGGAEVIVAISRWTRDLAAEVLQELGLEERIERIRVVPLGTDPATFRPGRSPEPLIRRYGLPDGRWLVTVARLVPHKGIDTTIRVLARLAAGYPDLRYAVVGAGGYQDSLHGLARELGVADRVVILPDVSDELLPLAYALATVYVGLSRQTPLDVEGFGIALLEASASGKPVVAGRSGGVPDAVREGEIGLLVDPEDVGAAAVAIGSLLDDPVRAAELGAGGRRAVESFYNWSRVIADLRSISSAARSALR